MSKIFSDGIDNNIAYTEAIGLIKVFEAYAEECAGEEIMSIGFNKYTGIIYIALDNGISIISELGNEAEFIVLDNETDEEMLFNTYQEALDQLENF